MLLHNHRYQTPMDTDLPIERVTLDKIRKLVHVVEPAASANIPRNNDAIHRQGQQQQQQQQQHLNPPSNHQLLKSYNTLIQSLAHEYVLRHTTVAKHRCDLQRRRQQQQKFSQQHQQQQQQPQQIWLRHSQSHQALQQMANTNTTPPSSTKQHKRTSSSGVVLLKPSSDPTQSWQQQQRSSSPPNAITDNSAFPKVDSGISFHDDGGCFDNDDVYHQHQGDRDDGVRIEDTIEGDLDDNDNQHNYNDTAAGHEVLVPITDKTEARSYNQNTNCCETMDENSNDEERVLRLLQLLDVFVRLKESTGVERATLASILVASDRDDDRGSRLMVADLVMEVENQRRQVASLHELLQQQPEPPNLLIAQELVSMSPQMKQLQDTILLQGFDLDSLKRSFEQGGGASGAGGLWNLLTLYIDKLHSLELLIVEEIECCVGIRAGQGDAPLVIDYSNSSMMVVGDHSSNSNGESSSHIVETSSRNNNNKPGPVVCRGEVFGLSAGYTNEELRERIESLAPEEIKRCLLEAASSAVTASTTPAESQAADGSNSQNDAAEAAAGRRVEDLLAELSKAPASKEWEIDLYEIRFLKRIGQGNAGTTYLADWKGLNVAVKVASITEMGLDGWRTEVQNLQRLHHPNVIRLLGSVYHPSPLTFCLVLEYCNGGELADALQRVTPPSFFFRVADGLAKGMAYLHSRGVIHRDIKPSNTLLDGDVATGQFTVKMSDFGLAAEASPSGDRTAETGTYRWMAPEVIRHEDYSQTADVYSFAVVLWQLVTRDEPFHHQSQVDAAAAVALENARPPFPENTPPAIAKLIQTCWSREPNERLSFDEIVEELQEMEKVLDPEEREWIEAPLGHTVYRRRTTMMAELEIPERTLNVPSAATAAAGEKKKPKGFRTLFNRKSTHF